MAFDERRVYQRATAATTVNVYARHNAGVTLTIASISLGGARMVGAITVEVGERVQILFDVDGQPVALDCEVLRRVMIDMATDHIAVRFIDVKDDAAELIRRLIQQSVSE